MNITTTAFAVSLIAFAPAFAQRKKIEPVPAYETEGKKSLDWFNMLNESNKLAFERYWTGCNALFQIYGIRLDRGRFNEWQLHFRSHEKRLHMLFNDDLDIPWFNQVKMIKEELDAQKLIVDLMSTVTRKGIKKLKRKMRDKAARDVVDRVAKLESSIRSRIKMLHDEAIKLTERPVNS